MAAALPTRQTLMDSGGPLRMVWTSPAAMDAAVGHELHNARRNYGDAGAGDAYVRIGWCSTIRSVLTASGIALNRKGVGGVAGVTFVRVTVKEDTRDDN